MSKKCELTGKIPLKGHKVSHANNKVKRRFLPNLKKVKFTSNILKRNLRLNVSNAGVRSVDKKGSFDQFLKNAKNKNLSPRLKKIRKTILAKTTPAGASANLSSNSCFFCATSILYYYPNGPENGTGGVPGTTPITVADAV